MYRKPECLLIQVLKMIMAPLTDFTVIKGVASKWDTSRPCTFRKQLMPTRLLIF